MLPATPNPLVMRWFDGWCRRALRRHFYRVHLWLESAQAWDSFDPGVSRLYVANHSSFWDGIVLSFLIRRFRAQPLYCMIDEDQVREHPFFRRVGGFSVNRRSKRDGARAIQYAADLLNSGPCAIVVFPQGRIQHNDTRPLHFEAGAAHIVRRCPGLRVVPLALRYEFWGEQRAEAMIRLGDEMRFAASTNATEILDTLREKVAALLDELRGQALSQRPGDHVLLVGRRSISRWKSLFRRP